MLSYRKSFMNVDAYHGEDSVIIVKMPGRNGKRPAGVPVDLLIFMHGFSGPILPERYLDEAALPDLEQNPISGGE